MKIPGTNPPPDEAEPGTPAGPAARARGDHIAADIGDAASDAQIAVGKDIQQTAIHTEGGAYVGRDANTGGGDFVAGSKNVQIEKYIEKYYAGGEGTPPRPDPRALYRAPRPATLYGRDDLTAKLVAELIDPASQRHSPLALSALRGLPGVGKTALALHLAHHPAVTAAFTDGIFWVALGPQMDANSLLAELGRFIASLGGSALGLTTPEQHSALLASLWPGPRLLLVLDDCWQPAHARPFVDALPATGRCLLTTRQTGVADDLHATLHQLPLLAPPPSRALLAAGGTLARRAVEGYPIQADRLAQMLGHLPLALEVAARHLQKRARADGPAPALAQLIDELASEEGRVLRLRASQRRPGLDEAEPSLEAVLALSYNGLADDNERQAFVRLAVCGAQPLSFEAGVMAALWDAGQTEGLSESRRGEVRAALVDAGLLTRLGDGGGDGNGGDNSDADVPVRYSLHQTIAAYAASRLAATGQPDETALAHARYYASLTDAANDLISGQNGSENGLLTGLAWLDLEIDQIRRAIGWALDQSNADGNAALRDLVRPLRNYAIGARNLHREYGAWLEPTIAACRVLEDRSGEANVLQAQGDVLSFQDKRDEALEKYDRALALFQAVGARLGEANVLKAQGNLELQSGEETKGLALLEQARQLYARIGARVGLANIGIGLGRYAAAQGNFVYAIECMQPAADFGFEIGHPLGEQLQTQIDGWRRQTLTPAPSPSQGVGGSV